MENLFKGIMHAIRDVVTLGGRLSESSEEMFDDFEEKIREEFDDFEDRVREWIRDEIKTVRKPEVKK